MEIKDSMVALGVPFGLIAGAGVGVVTPSIGIVMGAGYGMVAGIILGVIAQVLMGKFSGGEG